MKHLITLLAALIITSAASAQTDSIGVYAVRGDSLISIHPVLRDKTKGFLGNMYYTYEGLTSSTHFKTTATLRLYISEPTMGTSVKYGMFTKSDDISDFGIAMFTPAKHNRLVHIKECPFKFRKAKNGKISNKQGTVTITKLRDNVYEIQITAEPGEYALVSVLKDAGYNASAFDFTIE